jgi:hypothetical protein
MSFDLAVWHSPRNVTTEEAGQLYVTLCESDSQAVVSHPAMDAFYEELIARYPEIDTVPDDRIDDHDYCPWSCALDHGPGHVLMPCVWSQAENVNEFVHALAEKHGLVVYNPQHGRVYSYD